ncbi:MAG: M20/M25/M40 family metallo-hydrolase [Pedosphaera sp.]|nr:M20/M25/M40 family metallo-hydrolase [Pedosphaera sp.]
MNKAEQSKSYSRNGTFSTQRALSSCHTFVIYPQPESSRLTRGSPTPRGRPLFFPLIVRTRPILGSLFVVMLGVVGSVSGWGATWQKLFDGKSHTGWRPTEFAGGGAIEIEEGAMILNQGALTGVNYTNSVPKLDYEIELEAKRVVGSDFFCGLTFPVDNSFCTWIVGGWGGSVVGLSSIDGEDAANNSTTRFLRFEQDQWYRLRLRVSGTNISAWIDGDRMIDADIRERTIGLRPGDIELSKPLGIAAYSTTAALRNIQLRSLDSGSTRPSPPPAPSVPQPSASSDIPGQLITAALETHVAWPRLAQLCDTFGPRFSGSTNLELAIDWILAEMKRDGLSNVHGEPVSVPRWVRGRESAALLEPKSETLPMLGLGGSIGTGPDGIRAEVLVVQSYEELKTRAADARGRIVVFNAPYTDYGESVRFRVTGAVEAARAGAVASLIRSVTDFSLQTPHTGMMQYDPAVPKIPHAALSSEDTDRLARWQKEGRTLRIHLKMEARQEADVLSRNIIAEIPGRERPEEFVIVGGHIDSWDVGQGAQDDGGNCVAAWEVLRLIRERGLQPRRTIRCVLWTNEENGLRGARAYRDQHRPELARHVVAIEADSGTYAPLGFGFTGSDAAFGELGSISRLLESRLKAGKLTRGGGESDLGPLLEEGVPILGLRVDGTRYFWFHHTSADTVDKVSPKDLAACTAALAAMVWQLADAEVRLPR